MKKNELTELRSKKVLELSSLLEKLRSEIMKIQVEKWQLKTKNVNAISNKKKDIARILTIIRENQFKKV